MSAARKPTRRRASSASSNAAILEQLRALTGSVNRIRTKLGHVERRLEASPDGRSTVGVTQPEHKPLARARGASSHLADLALQEVRRDVADTMRNIAQAVARRAEQYQQLEGHESTRYAAIEAEVRILRGQAARAPDTAAIRALEGQANALARRSYNRAEWTLGELRASVGDSIGWISEGFDRRAEQFQDLEGCTSPRYEALQAKARVLRKQVAGAPDAAALEALEEQASALARRSYNRAEWTLEELRAGVSDTLHWIGQALEFSAERFRRVEGHEDPNYEAFQAELRVLRKEASRAAGAAALETLEERANALARRSRNRANRTLEGMRAT